MIDNDDFPKLLLRTGPANCHDHRNGRGKNQNFLQFAVPEQTEDGRRPDESVSVVASCNVLGTVELPGPCKLFLLDSSGHSGGQNCYIEMDVAFR